MLHQHGAIMSAVDIFGPVISSYSRANAIEDGVLADMMQGELASVCRQHYKHPIAMTSAVFDIMERAVNNPRWGNDYAGILHDMLHMSRVCGRSLDRSTVLFPCIITCAGRKRNYTFKLQVHPGDDMEPVITIMLPEED